MSTKAGKEFVNLFYTEAYESGGYVDFLARLSALGFDLRDYVGHINQQSDIEKAIEKLRQGDPDRIIGSFVGGRVGGFTFNAFHQQSINIIVELKSFGGQERQRLFSAVCPLSTVNTLVDRHLVGNIAFEKLSGHGFIQLPVVKEAIDLVLPAFCKVKKGITYMQFFIPPKDSLLHKIVDKASSGLGVPMLGGTSANFTGFGSIGNRWQAALFCLGLGIYWLDDSGSPSLADRGSYPIVSILDGQMTLERPGCIAFEDLQSRVES